MPTDRVLVPGWDAIAAAHAASASVVRRTPVLSAASLSARLGGTIVLKAENLQRTGSFKLRGAMNKLRNLPEGAPGVVAGSAGNHGQSVAYAARALGLACEVYMPVAAAVSKAAAVEAFGAVVHRQGTSVDECVELARAASARSGFAMVHPFDDLNVITGQAGLGLEVIEQVPDLATVVLPVGGGGLASGVALAVKQKRPNVAVIGVQAQACAAFSESLSCGHAVEVERLATLADGIAIKRPGGITLELARRWLDGVVTVDEDAIAEAMVLLAERSKLVVEGAGAAALAALLAQVVAPSSRGTTAVVVSGGNVDIGVLAAVTARHETRAGRRLRVFARVPDRPGGLSSLLAALAEAGGNVLQLDHVRDGVELEVGETGVELILATRGPDHATMLIDTLAAEGFLLERL